MQRIVLDTNCLIQIIPKKSKYRNIWDKILSGKISLCVTTEILDEYSEVLSSMLSKELSENVLNTILNLSSTQLVNVFYKWELIQVDYDDNKFVDCAISCNAKYIVSNDRHFDVLKKIDFPKVKVINLQKFNSFFKLPLF